MVSFSVFNFILLMLERKQPESDIYNLSKSFALRIVNLYKYLRDIKKEYVISKQLL